jgi:hypothetical protein
MDLECECGYVATGESNEVLVFAAQSHAWEVHQTRLAAPTILSITGRRSLASSDVSDSQQAS